MIDVGPHTLIKSQDIPLDRSPGKKIRSMKVAATINVCMINSENLFALNDTFIRCFLTSLLMILNERDT